MKVSIDKNRCRDCNYCQVAINCPGEKNCTACGACVDACPCEARFFIKDTKKQANITCSIDGDEVQLQSNQTVLQALKELDYVVTQYPTRDAIFAPCRTGGCYSCAVQINSELKPSCVTPIRDGMIINTHMGKKTPKRIISGFQGHYVGGVGTPKELVSRSPLKYLEVACFASGCLYRCPTCQNWTTTYLSRSPAITPKEASKRLTTSRRTYQVDRMAISGGESTLNRKWLISFVKNMKRLNTDKDARIHIDTNAAILTHDYIDELVEAGMTDIGPDLKGINLETFMNITQVKDEKLAEKYLSTSWDAVNYILDNYIDNIFLGVGIPYNKSLMSLDEISEIGSTLTKWDPGIQVTVLDYRPEFRAQSLRRPTYQEMLKVKDTFHGSGLKKVICQTTGGYVR